MKLGTLARAAWNLLWHDSRNTESSKPKRRPELEALEERELPATILGSAFVDRGTLGVQDPGETLIRGAAIVLTGSTETGDAIRRTVTTNASGVFRFNNLAAGTYRLTGPSSLVPSIGPRRFTVEASTVVDQGLGFRGLAPGAISLRQFLSSTKSSDYPVAVATGGHKQSPINIDTSKAVSRDLTDLSFNYSLVTHQHFINTGTTIEVELDAAAKAANTLVDSDGKVFQLQQFHFHVSSEHTVDGQSFAGELHLVHKDAQGKLLVVGILLQADDSATPSAAYQELLANLPPANGETEVDLNPAGLLPASTQFYAFSGSLTTKPFTEGVRWRVMAEPVKLTAAQIQNIKTAIGGNNNRPIQPLNGRQVVIDTN